uniref:R3H domain-containing protein n=1 Tax=Rhodochaete parvula TaxID=110510 RepID=A0A220T0K9_9RHOD|nr:hypothetical protein Rhodc_106 [Rhodochaete parvula]
MIHENVEESIDCTLQGNKVAVQERIFNPIGKTIIQYNFNHTNIDTNINTNWKTPKDFNYTLNINLPKLQHKNFQPESTDYYHQSKLLNSNNINKNQFNLFSLDKQTKISIYSYGINLNRIENLILLLNIPIKITRKIDEADVILSIRSHIKQNTQIRQLAKLRKIRLHTIRSVSDLQIIRALCLILSWDIEKLDLNTVLSTIFDENHINELEALEEVRLAIEKIVIPKKKTVELIPRNVYLRKIQHELIHHYHLKARSVGEEPKRKLQIYPL